ncbi:MAG: phosphotransferase [Actinomycetota bacterium]|nr:phosphotransferase [Actinomycetota bacterium]
MIDLHSHILPGFDDGVRTIEDARELARTAVAEGVTAIAATPHVRDDYPTTPDEMEQGVALLREDFEREGIAIEVLHGGEIAFDRVAALDDDDLRRFTFGQSGRYILLEPPYSGWALGLEASVHELHRRRFTVVLAHPERNAAVQSSPERLAPLVAAGMLVQLTAGSLAGKLGGSARKAGLALVNAGLVHLVGSDAHGPGVRPFVFAAGAETIHDEALRRWLFDQVPAAIVAGEELPDRPERRRWGRRGRR